MDALGLYADGSSRLVTTFATWTSADPTVATVSAAGTVKGLAPGSTVITATLGLPAGSVAGAFTIATPVTITPPQLDAIAVMPLAQTILRDLGDPAR